MYNYTRIIGKCATKQGLWASVQLYKDFGLVYNLQGLWVSVQLCKDYRSMYNFTRVMG